MQSYQKINGHGDKMDVQPYKLAKFCVWEEHSGGSWDYPHNIIRSNDSVSAIVEGPIPLVTELFWFPLLMVAKVSN